jgi:carboxyl-terminal processing protease
MMNMDTYRKMAMRSASFAIVAAVAFGGGLMVGNASSSSAAVIKQIPLLSDGLDPSIDSQADLTDFWKAWNSLQKNFVQTHASNTIPNSKDKVYGAIAGLASSYKDPYTIFMPPKESEKFAADISGTFGGVGMEIDKKDNMLVVVAPLKGTPAETAGIKTGDHIAAIDKKVTDKMSTEEAVSKIRGPIGTTVELTIIRAGKVLTIPVVRAKIEAPQTEDGLDKASGVYHIALFEFTATSVNLFNEALSRFKASGSDKLIIDLRGNPGGYLDSAVIIASHFLPKGKPIVTEDYDGKEDNKVHTSLGLNDISRKTKVAVLIDGGSASASEILAGGLKDNHAATVIGTRSFGKGSVQQLIPIGDASLKVTVARWVTPAGVWIMGNGITPDIEVPYTQKDAEAKKDPQLERAITFLTTGK